jgi:hypothetical protein
LAEAGSQVKMSAFNLLSANFPVTSKDLEIGDEAKHDSDICDARSRSVEVYPSLRKNPYLEVTPS